MNADPADIQLRIRSSPQLLACVRALVETACTRSGMREADAGQVVLAVDEALANVMRHGYDGRDDQPIWVAVRFLRNEATPGIEICIRDECPEVDLSSIKGRPLDEIRPGGLGVHIIHSAMDHVSFKQRDDGVGVELTMRKFWQAEKDVPSAG